MKFTLLILFLFTLPLFTNAKTIKYLKLDFFHIVLVQVNGHLVNDSTELSFLKPFYEQTKFRYAPEAMDTAVNIIKRNKSFFIGMYFDDLKKVIDEPMSHGSGFATYTILRYGWPGVISHDVLIVWYKNGRIVELATPAYHEYVSRECPHKGIKKLFFWKK